METSVLVCLSSPSYPQVASVLNTLLAGRPNVRFRAFSEFEDLRTSDVYGKIEVLIVFSVSTPQFLQILRENPVKWVHSNSAGVDRYLVPEFVQSSIPLTNARGVYSQSLSEYVISAVLHFSKNVSKLIQQKETKQWKPLRMQMIAKKTMVILGFGDIGQTVGRVAKMFNMRVIGIRKSPAPHQSADVVVSSSEMWEVLPQADFLVMCLPRTADTYNIISTRELSLLKSSAVLVNIGRGGQIDEAALSEALINNRIAGAALDVYSSEPLSQDSPLWDCPNLLMSSHNADNVEDMAFKSGQLFIRNLDLYLEGRIRESYCFVEKGKGY